MTLVLGPVQRRKSLSGVNLFFSDVPSQSRRASRYRSRPRRPSVPGSTLCVCAPHRMVGWSSSSCIQPSMTYEAPSAEPRAEHESTRENIAYWYHKVCISFGAPSAERWREPPPPCIGRTPCMPLSYRSAECARISNASLHTLVPPRRSHSHVAHAGCTVLESHMRRACRSLKD